MRGDVTLVSYGDMLRVPGSTSDLLRAKAQGADVRIVYSPLEALTIARAIPDRKVVFLAIGFETTAPANAMTAWQAKREGLKNFSMLVSHVLVPPAIRALMTSTPEPGTGLHCAGPCVHGDGISGVRSIGSTTLVCRLSWEVLNLRICWKAS